MKRVLAWTRFTVPVAAAALLLAACGGETERQTALDDLGDSDGEANAPATDGDVEPVIDETISFVVPFDAGGGYDATVRMLAPHLADAFGTRINPVNEPGAGSLLASNVTFARAGDPTRLQIHNMAGVLASQIAGADGHDFDLREFSWLGRVTGEPGVVATSPDGRLTSWEDLSNDDGEPFRFGSTGPGSADFIGPHFLINAFGFNIEIISGFESGDEARLAVVRGDIDAFVGSLDSALPGINDGDLMAAVLFSGQGDERVPDDTDVLLEQDLTDEERVLSEALVALFESGRMVSGTPDLDPDILAEMRTRFEAVLTSDEVQADAEAQDQRIAYLNAEESEAAIAAVLDSPQAFQDLIRETAE